MPRLLTDSAGLPAGHPAAGKARQDGTATAYVCRGQSCSLPVTSAAALSALLQGRQAEGEQPE